MPRQIADSTFFSAASFYPGRDATVPSHLPSRVHTENGHPIDDDGDTEVESEEEWLTEPQPVEQAPKMTSKALETILVEVSTSLLLLLRRLTRVL